MKQSKVTKVDLLMDLLSDSEWHWADELATKVGWRFGATINEARNKSYVIETSRIGLKHRYRLVK
jgi:hypothetical protein